MNHHSRIKYSHTNKQQLCKNHRPNVAKVKEHHEKVLKLNKDERLAYGSKKKLPRLFQKKTSR